MKAWWRRRSERERDLEREVRAHLELEAEEARGTGRSPIDARDQARRAFGSTAFVKEDVRQAWGWRWLDRLSQDIKYSLRQFRRNLGFSVVAALTLGLGIGANAAIFSLTNAILLRTLPVERPQELERVGTNFESFSSDYFSYPMYQDLRERNQVFSGLIARHVVPVSLAASGTTTRGVAELVSGNYFSVLGVRPFAGRLFSDEDNRVPMNHAVAVLNYGFWRERFAGDPEVLGKTLRIDNYPFTIVGIAPAGFFGVEMGSNPDLWVPIMMQPQLFDAGAPILDDTGIAWLKILGRRASGVDEAAARAGINVTLQQVIAGGRHKLFRRNPSHIYMKLDLGGGGFSRLRSQFENPLYLLAAIVGLVLLIACANIANLLLARSAARLREIAVRLALGADRARLIRQLLTESTLLGLVGGATGLLMSMWFVRGLFKFLPSSGGVGDMVIPLALDVRTDARVLWFTVGVSIATGVLFGLTPALQATRADVTASLKEESGASGTAMRRFGVRNVLVISQVAMSLVLLVGADLFLRSLRNTMSIDTGLRVENVLVASVNPVANGYSPAQVTGFRKQLEARLQSIAGIRAAGVAEVPLLSGSATGNAIHVSGQYAGSTGSNSIDGGFFPATGNVILRGRNFGPQDTATSPKVAIMNESAARLIFPNSEALGKRVWINRVDDIEIVGIAKDTINQDVHEKSSAVTYIPVEQDPYATGDLTIYLRTDGDPLRFAETLREEVRTLDAELPLYGLKTLATQKSESLVRERLTAALSEFFGALALLLAAVGMYGVIAFSVRRRTREIGIRMSLGAARRGVVWMVLRDCLTLAAIGIAAGVPLSLALSRLAGSQLYGVTPRDPAAITVAMLLLALMAAVAGALPAYRASRVDPMVALRYE